jgi:S-adenosylmethionine:tRNA ribosyltransferase-isomerase
METSTLDYDLPGELIAQHPAAERDGSRLMVVRRDAGTVEHRTFSDITGLLDAGDLLVVNDSRVVPARLVCHRKTGGRVDVLLVGAAGDGTWNAFVGSRGRLAEGEDLTLPDGEGTLRVGTMSDGFRRVSFPGGTDVDALLSSEGRAPLPPYIKRRGDDPEVVREDLERYQTVYADPMGSIAAPTAGLHFTDGLLDALAEKGVERVSVTLHVGAATFLPIRTDTIEDHRMLTEHYRVSQETSDAIHAARDRGGRVVCVGTTTCRALESAFRDGGEASGWTELFIHPPFEFRAIDAMLTNFHLPRSTLLLLVFAFGGEDVIRRAYAEAVRERYRFYSYGDAMLIL